jgi:hypothetical protein
MSQGTLTVALLLLWLGAGAGVGVRLARAGFAPATSASALLLWPALLGLVGAPEPRVAGPFAARIEAAFGALAAALANPAAAPLAWEGEASALREALHAADQRIVLVDGLLSGVDATGDAAVDASRAALVRARDHAAAEIEAVLAGVVELRLQVGLLALAGDPVPVRDRLRGLRARARALAEVDTLGAGGSA